LADHSNGRLAGAEGHERRRNAAFSFVQRIQGIGEPAGAFGLARVVRKRGKIALSMESAARKSAPLGLGYAARS